MTAIEAWVESRPTANAFGAAASMTYTSGAGRFAAVAISATTLRSCASRPDVPAFDAFEMSRMNESPRRIANSVAPLVTNTEMAANTSPASDGLGEEQPDRGADEEPGDREDLEQDRDQHDRAHPVARDLLVEGALAGRAVAQPHEARAQHRREADERERPGRDLAHADALRGHRPQRRGRRREHRRDHEQRERDERERGGSDRSSAGCGRTPGRAAGRGSRRRTRRSPARRRAPAGTASGSIIGAAQASRAAGPVSYSPPKMRASSNGTLVSSWS